VRKLIGCVNTRLRMTPSAARYVRDVAVRNGGVAASVGPAPLAFAHPRRPPSGSRSLRVPPLRDRHITDTAQSQRASAPRSNHTGAAAKSALVRSTKHRHKAPAHRCTAPAVPGQHGPTSHHARDPTRSSSVDHIDGCDDRQAPVVATRRGCLGASRDKGV
jgi:hypothetical protein